MKPSANLDQKSPNVMRDMAISIALASVLLRDPVVKRLLGPGGM